MENLLVILRKPPYSTTNASEAIRHAGGASGFDYKAILYLIDGGVYSAKKNQSTGDTGFSSVGDDIELMSDEMDIYASKDSLESLGLKADDLIEGVKVDDGSALSYALKTAQTVMVF